MKRAVAAIGACAGLLTAGAVVTEASAGASGPVVAASPN